MSTVIEALFNSSGFAPHGFCLAWQPVVLSAHVFSDIGLALSYISTAVAIAVFVRRRPDLEFPWVFHAFTIVFGLCGLVHLSDLLIIWTPVYGVQGLLKAGSAVVSILTALLLWRLLPRALELPGPSVLRRMNRQLQQEVEERRRTGDELRFARDKAELASRAKSDFLATMSHELRTPLNAVLGFSEALAMEIFGPLNSRQHDYVGAIRKSGSHLLQLINNILDISKIDAGRLDLACESVRLAEVVDAALPLIKGRAAEGGVTLETDLDAGLPPVWGDPLRLRQIMVNLLSNAVKFTPDGGWVRVTATLSSLVSDMDAVAVRVSDTGIGMSAEDIPRALEMFTQIDNRLTRRYDGTGIGLPLTKALVELHGGRLDIESHVGIGTTVSVVLPIERGAKA